MFEMYRESELWVVSGTKSDGTYVERAYVSFKSAQSFAVATFTSAKLDALTVSA